MVFPIVGRCFPLKEAKEARKSSHEITMVIQNMFKASHQVFGSIFMDFWSHFFKIDFNLIATDKYLEHHLEKKSENRHSGDVLSMGSKKSSQNISKTYT
jgi:hypothetical protein